jgi:hypothetical protein
LEHRFESSLAEIQKQTSQEQNRPLKKPRLWNE